MTLHPSLIHFYSKNPELRVMHNLVKNLEVPRNDTFIKPSVWNLGRTLDMMELILTEFCEENEMAVRRRRLSKVPDLNLQLFVSKFFLEETSKTRHQCERVRLLISNPLGIADFSVLYHSLL